LVSFDDWVLGLLSGLLVSFLGKYLFQYLTDARARSEFLESFRSEIHDSIVSLQREQLELLPHAVWDAAGSSGALRLFRSNEIIALSRTYSGIRNFNYEAQRSRDRAEQYRSESNDQSRKQVESAWKTASESALKTGKSLLSMMQALTEQKWSGTKNLEESVRESSGTTKESPPRRSRLRSVACFLLAYGFSLAVLMAAPYFFIWRGNVLGVFQMPEYFFDLSWILLAILVLPLMGMTLLIDVARQYPYVLLLVAIASVVPPVLKGFMQLHGYFVSGVSAFLSENQYTLGRRYFCYVALSLAFGTLALAAVTSPLLLTPDIQPFAIARAFLLDLAKTLFQDRFRGTLIGEEIWTTGLVFLSLAPPSILGAKITLRVFSLRRRTDQIRKAVGILLIAFYASLFIVRQVIVVNLYPSKTDFQAYINLASHYLGIAYGVTGLLALSLLCSIMDYYVFRPPRPKVAGLVKTKVRLFKWPRKNHTAP